MEYQYVKPQCSDETYRSYPGNYPLTVGELIEILKELPSNLEVTYDSGYGKFYADQVHYNNEKVILND